MATNVYGIDFSGSKAPGQSIWITEGTVTDPDAASLDIDRIQAASDRFNATGRTEILDELRTLIRDQEDAVFGIDFPFGLPAAAVDTDDWTDFLKTFATEFAGKEINAYPGEYATDGRTRRETDYRFGGQSPMSPQVKYQVFYGLRDLLAPLVRKEHARVLPMQSPEAGTPSIIEIYPAATFGAERLYRTGYKNSSSDSRDRRKQNAMGLQSHEAVDIDDDLLATTIESHDALDSLCAAFAVRRAIVECLDSAEATVEGNIYA